MRTLMRVVPVVLSIALAMPAHAQRVIETPKLTIELVGLRHWTVGMIQDSLARYSPNDQLTAHACAAILRTKLHFADASVETYMEMPNRTKPYVAITVLEPTDSALVHYKPEHFADSLPTRAQWANAWKAFRENSQLAQRAIQTPAFFDATLSSKDSVTFTKVLPLHDLIANTRRPEDLADAMHVLETDGNYENRTLAAIVVGSFPERDDAWRTLANAMRDPMGIVTGTSSQILGVMTREHARAVDWSPIARELRYILDGTNLFAMNRVMETLARTSVSQSLAPALLGGGGAIVAAKLHSGDASGRAAAAELLAQLSGLPKDTTVDALEAWMRKLPTTSAATR